MIGRGDCDDCGWQECFTEGRCIRAAALTEEALIWFGYDPGSDADAPVAFRHTAMGFRRVELPSLRSISSACQSALDCIYPDSLKALVVAPHGTPQRE